MISVIWYNAVLNNILYIFGYFIDFMGLVFSKEFWLLIRNLKAVQIWILREVVFTRSLSQWNLGIFPLFIFSGKTKKIHNILIINFFTYELVELIIQISRNNRLSESSAMIGNIFMNLFDEIVMFVIEPGILFDVFVFFCDSIEVMFAVGVEFYKRIVDFIIYF